MKIALALVAAGLWPFSGGSGKDEGTIKTLDEQNVEVRTDAPVTGGSQRAIESYREFLKISDDPVLRAEAMRRLADLQLEVSEEIQLSEDDLIDDGVAFENAVSLYSQLLESYPEYAKNDAVLYQLARAYENSGDPENALAALDKLVREFPQTQHMSEAQFRRGEILFMAKRYYDAELAYSHVVGLGDSGKFFEQSLYKLGWAQFKQASYKGSLNSFVQILDRKLVSEDGTQSIALDSMPRATRELLEDGLRVMSISFSYMNGADSIDEFFSNRQFPTYAYLVYKSLGDLYLIKERYQDAAEVYKGYVERDPYHQYAPLLQVQVVEAYKQGGFPSLVLEGRRQFVERYGMRSPFWERYARNEHPKVVEHLKVNLTDLAQHHHALAQQKHKTEDFQQAARWYREYLDFFPEDPDSANTNFLLAEILFEDGRFAEATVEYERTAYQYPMHDKAAEAGYAALLSYRKQEESLTGDVQTEQHRDAIESSLRFARTFTEHEKTPQVMTNAAEELFKLGELDLAIQVAGLVITHQPPVDAGMERIAWTVKAHSHFDLLQFDQAEIAYIRIQSLMPVDDSEYGEIIERIASSIYRQAERARDSGNSELAVNHFMRVGAAAPTATIRAAADYDAATTLVNMKSWPRAVAALEHFRNAYPQSEYPDDVTRSLAIAYGAANQPVMAAAEFRRIGDNPNETPEVRREAAWKAADLFDNAGDHYRAVEAYTDFVNRYPVPLDEAMEARQKLVDMNLAAGDSNQYLFWLNEIIRADLDAGPARTNRSRTLAAKATLIIAKPKMDAFLAVRLTVPLKESLKVKKSLMQAALNAYKESSEYQIADVTTESTFSIAKIYHAFSQDLFDSERPVELSELEMEQYELLLEEQAYPFEEKAIEIYEVNARRASDGIYDEWVIKSFEELATLLPVRYAKAEVGETIVESIQ